MLRRPRTSLGDCMTERKRKCCPDRGSLTIKYPGLRAKSTTKERDKMSKVKINLLRFPRDLWSDPSEPFLKVDDILLEDIAQWIESQIPENEEFDCELFGKAPLPVMLLIGKTLGTRGCEKLVYAKPAWSSMTIWDDVVR